MGIWNRQRRAQERQTLEAWAAVLGPARSAQALRAAGGSPWLAHVARALFWDARLEWAVPDPGVEALLDEVQGRVLARVRWFEQNREERHLVVARALLDGFGMTVMTRAERSLVHRWSYARHEDRGMERLLADWAFVRTVRLRQDLFTFQEGITWAAETGQDVATGMDGDALSNGWRRLARDLMTTVRLLNVGVSVRWPVEQRLREIPALLRSFQCMAAVIGFPMESMGLHGLRLVVTSGQGHAHWGRYRRTPCTVELNATGACRAVLAHEWFHALDHALALRMLGPEAPLVSESLPQPASAWQRSMTWWARRTNRRQRQILAAATVGQSMAAALTALHRASDEPSPPRSCRATLDRLMNLFPWWSDVPAMGQAQLRRTWDLLWPTVRFSALLAGRRAATEALAVAVMAAYRTVPGADQAPFPLSVVLTVLEATGRPADIDRVQASPRTFLALSQRLDDEGDSAYMGLPREVLARCFEVLMYTAPTGSTDPWLVHGTVQDPPHAFYPRGKEALEVAGIMRALMAAVRPVLLAQQKALPEDALAVLQTASQGSCHALDQVLKP